MNIGSIQSLVLLSVFIVEQQIEQKFNTHGTKRPELYLHSAKLGMNGYHIFWQKDLG